jgi:chromate transporter
MSVAINLSAADWLSFLGHFLLLSVLSVGGAIATAGDMHRFLVDEKHWMADPQFSASIALAQAAPGPNVLFVALMGWNVGMNAGGYFLAWAGLAVAMVGILLPSTMITYMASQWGHRNRGLRGVRAFKQGMAPIVVALLVATGWILATGAHPLADHDWPLWVMTAVSAVVVWRTRIHLLWLLGAGALLGWFGIV